MIDEQWKPIGETGYFVSNTGKVASTAKGWLVLKPINHDRGYRRVSLFVGKVGQSRYIHRLVADAFLPPKPTPLHEINHVNGDKAMNDATNLVWVTPSENIWHSYHALNHKAARGESSGRARLTEGQVRDARRRRACGEKVVSIARDLGVSGPTISNIVNRHIWAWLV